METNVLFIVPPFLTYGAYVNPFPDDGQLLKKDGKAYGVLYTDMPMGVLALSSWIKQYATNTTVQVRLLNFNIELNEVDSFRHSEFPSYYAEAIRDYTQDFAPDIIGISTLFASSFQNMLDIGSCCRHLFPSAIIVAGGGVPTTMYRAIFLESTCFDALCYGEGESPLLALVNAEDPIQCLSAHSSWITKENLDNGGIFSHSYVQNLDEIPFCDYSLCAIDKYNENPTFQPHLANRSHIGFSIMSSLGCPFKCTFCASHQVHGRKMRYYSLARLKKDFVKLRDQYNANAIVITDDNVMVDKQRAVELISMIHDLGMRPILPVIGLHSLDREILEKLCQAGVEQLRLPIESGSERVLKRIMHKPVKLSLVPEVVNNCRDLGIYTHANIILGMPGETKQDIEEAREFLKSVSANWYSFFSAVPLVGSEIYDICVEKNYIREEFFEGQFKRAVIETEDFSAEYIQEMMYLLNLELNFVDNSDMRLGHYDIALKGFENAIRAKYDHFFAHFYSGICHEKLGENEKAKESYNKAMGIYQTSGYWRNYANHFNVKVK